jgi:hypothetical protein
MVEHPADRGCSLGFGINSAGLRVGVAAEQVVERVPARGVLGDQVGLGEVTEHAPSLALACACEAGGGGNGDVRAGGEAK